MTNTVEGKQAALVELLYKRTTAKGVDWELNEARNPQAAIKGYKVALFSGKSSGSSVEYVRLYNEFGEEIETFSDDNLADLTPPGFVHEDYYQKMQDLRKRAFRQASGADNAVDDLLSHLQDDDDNDI